MGSGSSTCTAPTGPHGLVGLFHRFGVQAFGWDAQEVRHLRELLAMGIDGVYSDHVARMVATVGEFSA